jgi:putative transposase
VIELKTHCVHLAGITTKPDAAYMARIARNLTDPVDGFLTRHRFLICNRDGKFTPQFKRTPADAGIQIILTKR